MSFSTQHSSKRFAVASVVLIFAIGRADSSTAAFAATLDADVGSACQLGGDARFFGADGAGAPQDSVSKVAAIALPKAAVNVSARHACARGDARKTPKSCQNFDAASLEARRQHWAVQIRTLPVLDVVKWILGAWDFNAPSAGTKLPSVIRAAKDESFAQCDCLIKAMQAGVAAQKGSVPSGTLIASGSRSFADQKRIWMDKWNFRSGDFDRISKTAAKKSRGLLVEGNKWSPKNGLHRIMWGLPKPTSTKDPELVAFIAAKAIALTNEEREQEILEASSAPGVSRHHAGTDFDIGEYGSDLESAAWTPGAKLFDSGQWLEHNAATWGFMRPFETKGGHGTGYMAEPWHWSYWPVAQALLVWARANRADMEAELHRQWQDSDTKAGTPRPEFAFIWNAWKTFVDNVDESPKF